MNIEKNLFYTEDHEWVKVEGSTATIGITDYAQHTLGDIVFVELPDVDDTFEAGDDFAVIESVKAASDALMPVDGKVIEINEKLDDEPNLLNEAPYDQWMVKIELTDEAQLEDLMDADTYKNFCEEQEG